MLHIQLYRYRTGTVLVPVARYQLLQYEAPTQAVRAVRGRVLEPVRTVVQGIGENDT